MRFFALAAAAVAVPSALAAVIAEPRPGNFGCGTRDPTPVQLLETAAIAEQEAAGNVTIEARQTVNVGVYFHVVAASTSLSDGYLTV